MTTLFSELDWRKMSQEARDLGRAAKPPGLEGEAGRQHVIGAGRGDEARDRRRNDRQAGRLQQHECANVDAKR